MFKSTLDGVIGEPVKQDALKMLPLSLPSGHTWPICDGKEDTDKEKKPWIRRIAYRNGK